jgi:hypothetical protein
MPVDESKGASPLVSIVLTDELGQYRMNLAPGRYYIQAGRAVGPTYYPASTTLDAADIISVALGSDTVVPNFTLRYPWELKVRGRVTGASPEELAGARVQLGALPFLSSPLSATVKKDGSFEFERVLPGLAYLALISISSPNSIAVTPVVVDADDVTGVELKLLRMMEVNGQVIVEGGGAPVGIYIRSGPTSDFGGDRNRIMADSRQRGDRPSIFLQGESTFFLRLTEGDHKVTVSGLPEGFFVKSILYGSTDITREPLRLRVDQVKEEIRITIGPK